MADERPVDDPVAQLGKLQSDFEDFKSTMLARLSRRPTGDVEPTIRGTPKAGTLFMQGQTVLRASYAALWQWVNDNALLQAGLFGPADGVTNFSLPNFTGRTIIGAGGANPVGAEIGADTKTISIANLPAHNHDVVGDTDDAGSHGGHIHNWYTNAVLSFGGGIVLPNTSGESRGNHSHGAGGLSTANTGSGTAFNVQQASKAVNWMIYV